MLQKSFLALFLEIVFEIDSSRQVNSSATHLFYVVFCFLPSVLLILNFLHIVLLYHAKDSKAGGGGTVI